MHCGLMRAADFERRVLHRALTLSSPSGIAIRNLQIGSPKPSEGLRTFLVRIFGDVVVTVTPASRSTTADPRIQHR